MTTTLLNEPVNSEPSDGTLVRRLRSGEEDAATALYLRYARRLAELARARTSEVLGARLDPEDVVQSVFRTFFRRVADGQYDVPQGEDLWKLLLVMSLNKIRALGNFHRAAKRSVESTTHVPTSDEFGPAATDATALQILEWTIGELLQELPAWHAPIIEMRIQGHDIDDIAQSTSRSKRTVERVLQGFRQRLASVVEHESESRPSEPPEFPS